MQSNELAWDRFSRRTMWLVTCPWICKPCLSTNCWHLWINSSLSNFWQSVFKNSWISFRDFCWLKCSSDVAWTRTWHNIFDCSSIGMCWATYSITLGFSSTSPSWHMCDTWQITSAFYNKHFKSTISFEIKTTNDIFLDQSTNFFRILTQCFLALKTKTKIFQSNNFFLIEFFTLSMASLVDNIEHAPANHFSVSN